MGLSTNFKKVFYKCIDCEKDIEDFEIGQNQDITCPYCKGEVQLYASGLSLSNAFVRKYVEDLEEGDLVYFATQDTSYEILCLREKGKKVKVSMRNYGSIELEKGTWVNCTLGTWSEHTIDL